MPSLTSFKTDTAIFHAFASFFGDETAAETGKAISVSMCSGDTV